MMRKAGMVKDTTMIIHFVVRMSNDRFRSDENLKSLAGQAVHRGLRCSDRMLGLTAFEKLHVETDCLL